MSLHVGLFVSWTWVHSHSSWLKTHQEKVKPRSRNSRAYTDDRRNSMMKLLIRMKGYKLWSRKCAKWNECLISRYLFGSKRHTVPHGLQPLFIFFIRFQIWSVECGPLLLSGCTVHGRWLIWYLIDRPAPEQLPCHLVDSVARPNTNCTLSQHLPSSPHRSIITTAAVAPYISLLSDLRRIFSFFVF